MMLVRNYIDKSPIHGIGVFAGEFIPKGTCIWELTPGCDQVYGEDALAAMTPVQREIVLFYGYVEAGIEGIILCCDNARHYNFSSDPNSGSDDRVKHGARSTYALRDIAEGEELTFAVDEDVDAARKLGEVYDLLARGKG
jgi:SET domain-containing protein